MWRRLPVLLVALLFVGLLAHRIWQSAGPRKAEHAHPPGVHGGVLVSVGGDRYHVEAVFTREGFLKLYTLGRDESRVIEVEAQPLTAHVMAEGDAEAFSVPLQPEPQPGDGLGKTSCFSGRLPPGLGGRVLEVRVPNVRIGGERFRLAFARRGEHVAQMPRKVRDDEERALYLVPGGGYTRADIEANGGTTPSQRFAGFQARHDYAPRPGDRLCPVTRTKANPECAWTVRGRVYEFCCPPCIDEFVRLAKEWPDQIEPPGAYVKR